MLIPVMRSARQRVIALKSLDPFSGTSGQSAEQSGILSLTGTKECQAPQGG